MSGVVLITGVSRYLGGRLAAQLAADPAIDRVIGIDTAPPSARDLPLLGRTEFVRADIRNPLIAKVMAQARVTTVVHAALMASSRSVGGRVPMQELNVIGTMQLLAACQKSEHVRRVVLKSTTAVYGSSAGDPAVFTEEMEPPRGSTQTGLARDAVEVEGYVRGFARRRPDVETTILRLAGVVGPGNDSAISRYLSRPVVPTVFGFDPRVQLLHEIDAVEALRLATVSARPGTVNVAGEGAMPLSQVLRRAGRIRVPVVRQALAGAAAALGNGAAVDLGAEERHLLMFGRVVDTTRLHTEFGLTPRFSTAAAVDSLALEGRRFPPVTRLALGVGSELLRSRRQHGPRGAVAS